MHIKGKFLNAVLSKELRKKYGKKSLRARKGDKVRIMRGSFKKKEGAIERVDTKKGVVYVSKIEVEKKEGSKVPRPVQPSNIMILELNLDDKMRRKMLERGKEK